MADGDTADAPQDPDKLLGELLDWAEKKDREGHSGANIVAALEAADSRLSALGWRQDDD